MSTSTTEERPGTFLTRCVLARDNIQCSIVALAPGEQTSCQDDASTRDHVVYVVDGDVTVSVADLTYLMHKDDAMFIPAAKPHAIAAGGEHWVKLLRVDVAPEREQPPIYAFPSVYR